MNLPAPAIVWINGNGLYEQRIAAFTWQTPTGLAWLESSYLDGGTHAFHVFEGEARAIAEGVSFIGPEGLAMVIGQKEALADPELCPESLREGLDAVQGDFARQGLDWAAEFARMTQVLAAELT